MPVLYGAGNFGETFDLGRAYSQAEDIMASQQMRQVRDLALKEAQKPKQLTYEEMLNNTKMLGMAFARVAENPASAPAIVEQLKRAGIVDPAFSLEGLTPEQIQQHARQGLAEVQAALRAVEKQDGGMKIGQYNPGDYTPRSWAAFLKGNDPSVLERQYAPPAPPNMSVIQLPEGQAAFNPRTASVTPLSSREEQRAANVADEAAKSRATASATAGVEQDVKTAERRAAWQLYETAVAGLKSGLAGTRTGPVSGRVPPVTAAQQIGAGGVAAMAPVLKLLFRVAGEGVFTDRDQALLLEMVPDRTDHPEARAAKIANIDAIVRAKLGMSDAGAAPATPPAEPRIKASDLPPPAALRQLREGKITTFANGERWTVKNGKAVRVQ